MTDQDPTQAYTPPPAEPPVPSTPAEPAPVAPSADVAPTAAYVAPAAPPAPPALEAAPPAAPMPTFAPPEAAAAGVATAPVVTAAPAKQRRSPLKWVVALVVVALVAGAAVAAAALLTGASGTPSVLAWTPADSVTYAEVRLDLPGNQQAELAKVVSAFPGFDDQAAFPTKINEVLDQLVGKASDGKQSYTADIQPWFGGQLSVSVGPVPSGSDATKVRALALASVKDAAKASAWAASTLAASGATSTTETYNGVTITVIQPKSDLSVMAKAVQPAYAVTGPVLALGDLASVKAAIDTGGKSGLNTNAQFKTASATITGDRLAFAYVDTAAIVSAASAMAPAVTDMTAVSMPAFLDDIYPAWLASAVLAKNNALVVETRMPHVDKLGPVNNAESTIPSLVPADTIALIDAHDVGAALKRLKAMLATDPSLKDGVGKVDDALKLIGGFDAAVGWVGETGIAVTGTGGSVAGGLVIVPTNPADAQRLFTQLRGFIELAGGSAGIKLTDETYNGATITVVDLSGAGALTGGAVAVPNEIKVAYAVTDKVVVFGSSVEFVKAVIDAPSGSNLASTDQFKSALAKVNAVNSTLLWVDVTGIRTIAEPLMSGDQKTEYESNLKPYLEPFDSVIATNVAGDVDEGTLVLSVTGN